LGEGLGVRAELRFSTWTWFTNNFYINPNAQEAGI
jgi:hypothetical protein